MSPVIKDVHKLKKHAGPSWLGPVFFVLAFLIWGGILYTELRVPTVDQSMNQAQHQMRKRMRGVHRAIEEGKLDLKEARHWRRHRRRGRNR